MASGGRELEPGRQEVPGGKSAVRTMRHRPPGWKSRGIDARQHMSATSRIVPRHRRGSAADCPNVRRGLRGDDDAEDRARGRWATDSASVVEVCERAESPDERDVGPGTMRAQDRDASPAPAEPGPFHAPFHAHYRVLPCFTHRLRGQGSLRPPRPRPTRGPHAAAGARMRARSRAGAPRATQACGDRAGARAAGRHQSPPSRPPARQRGQRRHRARARGEQAPEAPGTWVAEEDAHGRRGRDDDGTERGERCRSR